MTLDDLRKIAENATAGEWRCETYVSVDGRVHLVKADGCQHVLSSLNMSEEDAKFIATFNPQKVLEMIDQLATVKRVNETNRGAVQILEARLAAVEEVHERREYWTETGEAICDTCSRRKQGDFVYWPCDTIKAARGE